MMDIRKHRKSMNLSQGDMAKALGITQGSYSYKEAGIRRFNLEEIKILKKVLNVTYEELLGD